VPSAINSPGFAVACVSGWRADWSFRHLQSSLSSNVTLVATASPAHSDGDSYIRYLNDHEIFVPGINDAVRISRGSQVCTSLHNGMTPQQIIDANPIVYFDLRGVIWPDPGSLIHGV
jgi:hypothetical protein